jgi:hypothetical protein
MAPS